jgi:phosphoribosylformylglycinamidine (FGAM) synthase PurS component
MKTVRIFVTKKQSILDVEAKALESAIYNMIGQGVGVKKGVFFDISLPPSANIENEVDRIATSLLINDIIESYQYEILEQ